MRAILINPHTRTITETEVQPGLEGLYSALRADPQFSGTVECVHLGGSLDLWIDEEGNLSAGRPVWQLLGGRSGDQPFAGAALLMCRDRRGKHTALHDAISLDVVMRGTAWTDLVTTGSFGDPPPPSDGPEGFTITVTGAPIYVTREKYEADNARI